VRPIETIKDDWEATRLRLTHWWANELVDRAVLPVEADGYPPIRFHREGRWWQ